MFHIEIPTTKNAFKPLDDFSKESKEMQYGDAQPTASNILNLTPKQIQSEIDLLLGIAYTSTGDFLLFMYCVTIHHFVLDPQLWPTSV